MQSSRCLKYIIFIRYDFAKLERSISGYPRLQKAMEGINKPYRCLTSRKCLFILLKSDSGVPLRQFMFSSFATCLLNTLQTVLQFKFPFIAQQAFLFKSSSISRTRSPTCLLISQESLFNHNHNIKLSISITSLKQ